MTEIWAGSELLLRKYLAPASPLSRNRREKRGYSTPHITWLIIILNARPLSSIEFVIACSAKIRIIKHNNKFASTKVFAWSLNKLLSGKRILAVKTCINSLDITHLRDTNGRISLSSGESRWVNRLNSDLWRNCNQSMVALIVTSWRAVWARTWSSRAMADPPSWDVYPARGFYHCKLPGESTGQLGPYNRLLLGFCLHS